MTKEDQRREEVFHNEILTPDDISTLLDAKVFTNFKRIDKNGKHELTEFKRDNSGTIKDNLIIKGNNLLAIASLKKEFANKIKLIYIDPPYNTGNDGFRYNDSFNHSTWLTFMKNRLDIAKDLLKDDGVIFVQCDDNEQAYLKVLMDDIFGRENFISCISWERSATAGLGLGGKITNVTEYILLYQKRNMENNINREITRKISYQIEDFLNYKYLSKEGQKKPIKEFLSSSGDLVKIYKHSDFEINKVTADNFKSNFDKIFRTFLIQKENSFQHNLIDQMDSKSLYSVEYIPNRGKHKGESVRNFYYNKEIFSWLKDLAIYDKGTIIKSEKVNDF
jgi:adenine-specific DNA-methyltransferase